MEFLRRSGKRLLYDGLGYVLVIISPIIGWLPGPGGIAVFLAGLGLLSVHNPWADRLKTYTLKNGGKLVGFLFPKNSTVEWTYDILAISLLALASYLIWSHAAIWQISTGVSAFFSAVFIASMNRDRLGVQRKRKKKQSTKAPKQTQKNP